MNYSYALWVAALLLSMLAALEIGRRIGMAHNRNDKASSGKGLGPVEGAVFGLLGLLLAFTFSGAASRFEHRHDLIVQEANAISTAYLRLDLLEHTAQARLRPLFRAYVQSRLDSYKLIDQGEQAFRAGYHRSIELQQEIWQQATIATQQRTSPAVMTLVLSAINEMIDLTTVRIAAMQNHPPLIIHVLLVVFTLAGGLIAGYGMAVAHKRHWLHMILFAVCVTGTVYVILDLEYPRRGLIRVDTLDQHLEDVLSGMGPVGPSDSK